LKKRGKNDEERTRNQEPRQIQFGLRLLVDLSVFGVLINLNSKQHFKNHKET